MAIQFFDSNEILLVNLHAYLDGKSGGVYEFPVLLKNNNANYVYDDLILTYTVADNPDWITDLDPLAEDGWYVKMYEGARPTEKTWNQLPVRSWLALSAIGDVDNLIADTNSFKQVWIRLCCPANTSAGLLRDHKLLIKGKQIPV